MCSINRLTKQFTHQADTEQYYLSFLLCLCPPDESPIITLFVAQFWSPPTPVLTS